MGWSLCGTDSLGRPIGYGVEATCDHPGCNARIDRGLSYACGGMHGHNGEDCDGYFCDAHLRWSDVPGISQLCLGCEEALEASHRIEQTR